MRLQAQQDRNSILEAAAEYGVVRGIVAWRLSVKGTRFQIRNGVLFNLETPTGKKVRMLCLHSKAALSPGAHCSALASMWLPHSAALPGTTCNPAATCRMSQTFGA